MKVTKDMINEGLRSYLGPLKIVSFLMSRKWGIKLLLILGAFSKGKKIPGVHCDTLYIPSKNGGPAIRVRVIKPQQEKGKLPAMLYLHGGGYVLGNPDSFLSLIKQFIDTRPCVVIAPDYRKALTAPFPAGFNDCYDTLLWAKENANALGIDNKQFMVAGHSAGGGLTAAVTLKARDTQEASIAFQMPIYPMIDDRQLTPSAMAMDSPVWNTKVNAFAWRLYLSNLIKNNVEINAYAAPARNNDYSHFPPTITFVGELEPFKDETIAYVDALKNAGAKVRFRLFKGCYHGFDLFATQSLVAKEAINFTLESYAEYYDTYINV